MASRELTALIHLLTSRRCRRMPRWLSDARDLIRSLLPGGRYYVRASRCRWRAGRMGGGARGREQRILLYLHGGGYVIGSINTLS